MENNSNHKKSKALIITIIIVLLLLIIGYFLFANSAKIFGTKGVTNSNKIFSPLITSDSSKNLTPIDALAGEDIAKGDSVTVSGRDTNGAPIVVKTTTNGGAVFGYANQNIKSGSIGPIVSSSPSLWNSFTNFIGNIFGGSQAKNQALGGTWSTGDNGNTGTFTGSNGSGTWTATTGTGGTGIVTWTGTGNGTGTWTSSTGSGTWTNNTGAGGAGTGTWGSATVGGTWSTGNNGNTGTFTGSNGSGTWTATTGTGGTGIVTWTGTGNGTGTWTSSTGSGTWTNNTGAGGAGTGTWGTSQTGYTWSSGDNGNTGTFDGSNGSGTWTTTNGVGGTGVGTWTGTGNGTGTWTSSTGSGTWTNNTGAGGAGTGTWGSATVGGTWSTGNNGNTGTFTGSNGSGTWTATTGTGGTGIVTWTGTGNGTGTWTSSTGSGTWTNNTGAGGAGTGTWGSATVGGTWSTGNNGNTGTFTGSNGSGTWTATTGTGGTGIVTWTGTGNGTGTWTSSTGSGTWTNNTGAGGAGTGTWGGAQTESFWSSGDNGNTGIFNGGNGSGTWTATSGTGGTGIATWTGTGNGTGTWTSSTGSGTWTNGTGTGGAGTGTWDIGTGGAGTETSSYIDGTSSTESWTTLNNGSNGTFTGSNGSGTWITLNGTGGVTNATWTGTGNGIGTWTSSTGSGTWTNNTGAGGAGTGTWGTLGGSSSYNTTTGWSYNYADSSWTPPDSSTLPSVKLNATPTSVVSGGTSIINWSSKNTTSCNVNVVGRTKGVNGFFTTPPQTTGTSYSVTCINAKGSEASASIYISISNISSTYPSVTLTATPTSVVSGKTSVINWTSLNTSSCNENTTRAKTKSGSFTTPALTTGTSFSVTCIDAKGSETSDSIYVGISTIGGGSSDYDINNSPIVTVSANPLSVAPETSSDITWSALNATSCNDNVTGRTNGLTGTFNTGALTYGKEFSVVCKGVNGSSSGNVTVSVIGENDPPIVTVTATPAIVAPGTKTTIVWTSLNASSCNGGTPRDKTKSGSFLTGNITTDTAYTVTCIGAHGTGSATAYVFVNTSGPTTCPNGGTPPCNNIPIPGGSSSYNTCANGADNFDLCTTLNGVCQNGSTNPSTCDNYGQPCATGYTGTIPFCVLTTQTCENLDTLEFTPEQQADLEALLKRYYILADKIKTADDILSANNDADKTKSIINQAKTLTQQCTDQTKPSSGYTGPKQLGPGNPYFKTDTYLAAIWPIDPFNPPLNTQPTTFSILGTGFKPIAIDEDVEIKAYTPFTSQPKYHYMQTGSYYVDRLKDNYIDWPDNSGENPNAWKDTYMSPANGVNSSTGIPTDWTNLNAQTKWNQVGNDERATTTVIESLFRIW